MTRAPTDYTARTSASATQGATDVSQPVAGYFRMRLVSGGVMVGVEIRFGQPLDPLTGETMDRSLRWMAFVNGKYTEFDTVWPKCTGDPIDEKEYKYLSSLETWAKENDPTSPEANPRKKIDWLTASLTI